MSKLQWLMASAASAALFSAPAAFAAEASAASDATDGVTISGVIVQGVGAGKVGEPLSIIQLSKSQIEDTVNAVTVEDTLKYLPNIFVRRRHIGDTQAPITTRTSGVGSSARALIYADGVLLSALVANNNTIGSPRWGMVAPEEVDHIEARFGPFSAAYPGNSMGAVMEITTRLPKAFEASAKAQVSTTDFSQYATSGTYRTYDAGATIGDRRGPFAWWLSFNHLESESQPLTYATLARPAATSTAGTAVSGGFVDVNRLGQPILVVGAGGLEDQTQNNAKVKLSWDVTSDVNATLLVGYFGHDNDAAGQSYLTNAAGAPVYSGAVNVGGYSYNIAASAIANGFYHLEEAHWMEALSMKGAAGERFSWAFVATNYDFDKDEQRIPNAVPTLAAPNVAGAIVDLSGTGWKTLDGSVIVRPTGVEGMHAIRLGAHWDRYKLANQRFNTTDWRSGPKGALASASRGQTETKSLWAEDLIKLSDAFDLTLGARYEAWEASKGINYSLTPALNVAQPGLKSDKVSPKAVLKWSPNDDWRATASVGVAYRFPTVAELYQAVTTGNTLSSPNPLLKPEHAISSELSLERRFEAGRVRVSLFTEDVDDALISQTAPITPGSSVLVSYIQNVDKVHSRGVEIVGELNDVLIEGLSVQASASYVDAKIDKDPAFRAAEGKRIPQVPEYRWTAVATYRPNEKLSLTAAARYSDRVFATIDNTDFVTHTYQGFDNYFVVDVRAAYRMNDHVEAAFGIDNLNDRDYILFHPFPRRSYIAELKYSF
ncbi:TonB-dependent receptor [Phenylobacterium sp.]|uniref:TonB-dependent receptor n=1 Tax=Phenylobacterium sp. TaxID=1871053 RepID=UPI0027332F96|nr:TonB-dependent receptor [Phenylobacterium sp.]MDP3659679.1 TonB-dependent receptor [Phenylobacterium sp.]